MLFIASWSPALPFVCAATGRAIKVRATRRVDTLFMGLFLNCFGLAMTHSAVGITVELTGRGDYIQPSFQSIKLRKRLSALRSNELLDRAAI
jgi:hypothetical protein